MDEELIKKFLEQVRNDKFNIKDNVKFNEDLINRKVYFNDSNKTDSADPDDEFFEAFENFVELVCPKVDSGELQCKDMIKSLKKKESKHSYKKRVPSNNVKGSIDFDYRNKPEMRHIYCEKGISITDSLKIMRELRNREEELRIEFKKK
uniref:Uncharacterized protein n=1 Tax=Strongyloides stercoralis TaxID=6248 RepID=A0A0K0EFZ6_STRER